MQSMTLSVTLSTDLIVSFEKEEPPAGEDLLRIITLFLLICDESPEDIDEYLSSSGLTSIQQDELLNYAAFYFNQSLDDEVPDYYCSTEDFASYLAIN